MRSSFAALVLPAAALALASCAQSPEVDHPSLGDVDVPAQWAALELLDEKERAEGSYEASPWWRRFNRPDLDGIIARVLERNHDLRAAAERVFAAAAQARIAGADAAPQIAAVFDASRTRQNFIGLPIPGASGGVLSTHFTSLGVALDLTWELDLWGRIRAGRSAALADLEATYADVEAARLSLVGQAVKLWLGALEAAEQVELAEATLANYRATHETIVDRYERGLRPAIDVRFSRASIASAEAALASRLDDLDAIRRQIEVLAGDYPSGSIGADMRTLPEVPEVVPVGLPSDLLLRRPDISSAERRLQAAGARVLEARRAFFPRVSLTTSGGTSSNELEDLVDPDFAVWTLAGNLIQPLFQGGRLRSNLELAESRERELVEGYLATVLDAFREVESALAAESYLARREDALDTAARESLAARDLAEERYARGLDDILTVLEAQRRAFESRSQLLLVRRLRLENRADLHLALGGDWLGPRTQSDMALENDTRNTP
ncbi:MAG TPA: efflux transporter outer membrane subunit [Planctomycetota bacterium]|nr:efflux transporter outer membrane subunit [Planctomycetota bacterium]